MKTMKLSRGLVLLVTYAICVSGSHSCPENCKTNQKSSVQTCNKETGLCSLGCKSDYYGNTCNMSCDINCEGTCQQHDGSCKCLPGYTFSGGVCESHTGVKCKSNNHCLEDRCLTAGRVDCLYGCKPGWFGKFCEDSCSSNCFCSESGNCSSCEEGWYGSECAIPCSSDCLDKTCHRNGLCIGDCSNGMYGERCELKCSRHCMSGCDQLTGDCVQCVAGRYGSTCQSECSAGCVSKNCDRTGICTKGCERGHHGSFCNFTCENCKNGDCDMDTGECIHNGIQYWVGGGVAVVIIIIAAVLVYISYRFKRMRGFVYNTVKIRRPPQGGQNHSTDVAPANIVDDEITTTPPTVCPISTVRPSSYIHPQHSRGSANNLQIQPERPDSYCLPHYIELNENLMATPPQPPQETVARAAVIGNSSFSVVADVHVQLGGSNDENETGGEINIPLIAECFGNTETEDSTLNEEPSPEAAANYDHLFKD